MAGLIGLMLLLSPSSHALDLNEELSNVRLLDVPSQNIVVLNRGMEDGIQVGAHAKLRGVEGYAARGICVKTGLLTSHWRLYRIVDNQLISKDLTYTLVGMEDSEATQEMGKIRSMDYGKKLPDFDETKLQPPQAVNSDMAQTLAKDRRYLDSLKTKQTLFLEKNFDQERLKRDFRVIRGSLYASPFSVQKGPNNVQNFLYGANVANSGKKYQAEIGFDKVSLRAAQEKSGEDIVNDTTTVNGRFKVKEIAQSWDAFTDVTWRQARYGAEYAPREHVLMAPIGFTWKREPTRQMKLFELSYAPTYDTRTHETRNLNGQEVEEKSDGIRHAFRMVFNYQVSPDFFLKNDISYRPRQDISTWSFDQSDNFMQETFEASWRIGGKWFAAYEFRWMDDAQLRRINHMTRVVTINSFNIRYDFDF